MKTGVLYGIVANSKTRVRCVFCGVFIPKARKCIEEHRQGSKHKEYILLMSQNGISYNNKDLYCKPCNLYLPEEDSVASHIDSDDHENWMVTMYDLIEDEFMNIEPYLASESDEVHCEVCDLKIYCTLQNLEEHVDDEIHRDRLSEKLKLLNALFYSDNSDELWCKICNTYIENSVEGIIQHIDDDEYHMIWLANIEDWTSGQDVSIEKYLKYKNENSAYCNKCQMEIICNLDNIEKHVLSDSHLDQFS